MSRHAVHPGGALKKELDELAIKPTELARQIDVPANRLTQIIQDKRWITGDMVLRLGHWLKTNRLFWMNLPAQFDLAVAQR